MQRDLAIDTVRGLCIVTMIASHLAEASPLSAVLHPIPWVDGASGFILLSGLLVGMLQRQTMERSGERAGYLKLARRVRLIYVGHLAIVVVALAVGSLGGPRDRPLASIEGEGGWGSALFHALTLQINPAWASVLSLYVVVMIASAPLLWLLRRAKWVVAVAYVGVIYTIGLVVPHATQPPQMVGARSPWAYGAWFGLFAVGVGIGWFWRLPRVQALVRSRFTLTASVLLGVVGLTAAALLDGRGAGIRMLDKDVFGPGRLALAVVMISLLWRVTGAVMERAPAALRALTLLGSRSLDCYLILSFTVLITPSISAHSQDTAAGMLVAVATTAACWCWATARSRIRRTPSPQVLRS